MKIMFFIMICTLCGEPCTKVLNKQCSNIGRVGSDGKDYCLKCHEVAIFMGDLAEKPPATKEKSTTVSKPAAVASPMASAMKTSVTSIFCPKCQASFTERQCKCGFKNPLFKR